MKKRNCYTNRNFIEEYYIQDRKEFIVFCICTFIIFLVFSIVINFIL
jgi:hypothetical protein